ncbi:MAG: glycogen-binding domain-containing protein [Proteobacteria bacterium]|nr:glycogen-binding domain-containing protein [Pseudomonadota bacterium]MBU1059751.1 glycogen-binding domain-containing protein [Pseudomonadota bacterium]
MDYLISMYIDNELSLDEKIDFIEHVHDSKPYKEDAVALLEQEILLSASLNRTAPDVPLKTRPARILPIFNRSLGWAVAASLLLVFTFMGRGDFNSQSQNQFRVEPATVMHRFVIQRQNSQLIEITGSFTNWQSVALVPSGTDGYWEISMELPAGEHRYSFIVDGASYVPDPTVATREADDFGSSNSVLKVEA